MMLITWANFARRLCIYMYGREEDATVWQGRRWRLIQLWEQHTRGSGAFQVSGWGWRHTGSQTEPPEGLEKMCGDLVVGAYQTEKCCAPFHFYKVIVLNVLLLGSKLRVIYPARHCVGWRLSITSVSNPFHHNFIPSWRNPFKWLHVGRCLQ